LADAVSVAQPPAKLATARRASQAVREIHAGTVLYSLVLIL
jgi:hypothetical protein